MGRRGVWGEEGKGNVSAVSVTGVKVSKNHAYKSSNMSNMSIFVRKDTFWGFLYIHCIVNKKSFFSLCMF